MKNIDTTHLSWKNFEENYLGGPPREVVLPGQTGLRLFVHEDGRAFGMLFPFPLGADMPASPIAAILINEKLMDDKRFVAVSCLPAVSSKEFFYFLLAIADGIQLKGMQFTEAFDDAVSSWKELLRAVPRMSEEMEIGLIGELIILGTLIDEMKGAAVDCWTGPTKDVHDFRLGKVELEVKTTISSTRIHVINGTAQLTPSKGCKLFIISIQLERATVDSGDTLPEIIASVRRKLSSLPGGAHGFNSALTGSGVWTESEAAHYQTYWRLRSNPELVRVDNKCPRITNEILSIGLDKALLGRITDIHYRVNLEGQGTVLDGGKFREILNIKKAL